MHFYRDYIHGENPDSREMSAIKQDMLWSPHLQDRFLTFGADLKLYSLDDPNDVVADTYLAGSSVGIRTAKLLSLNSDNQYLKCVCWYPKDTYNDLLAVGLANGRVVLTSFNLPYDPSRLAGKEFIPRHARHCNALAWNSEDTNLLAAGLDKHRTDHSLLIWDIVKSAPFMGDPERRSLPGTSDSGGLATKPSAELANAETVHSLQWLSYSPKTVIAGISHKHLKMYDIRESASGQSAATTKAVFGVCTDPFFTQRVASYFESQVMIWDTRNFDKPMVTLSDTKNILKIAWCPTRGNLLATLSKDSFALKLYDIQLTHVGSDELEPIVAERNLQPVGHHPLQSFCWHPSQTNRIVATSNFSEFQNHIICERITLNWSPTSTLIWSDGRKLNCIDQTDEVYELFDDISIKMRQRAVAGYGLEMQHVWKNGELVKEDERLNNMWHWLDLVKWMKDEARFRPNSRGYSSSAGIHILIRGDGLGSGGTKLKSELSLRNWTDAPTFAHISTYKSADRDKALQLCGWSYDSEGNIADQFLNSLESEGSHERASAIAVFNLKILKAMEILNKGAAKRIAKDDYVPLSIVAMALSGYAGDRNSLWRDTCDRMRPKLKNPYLIATFAFLTCENDSYEEVLNEKSGLTVRDRVAFACIFLPDNKLMDFLDRLTQQLIESGNLDGLLLTGLCSQGVDLLQRYVDYTGDVQTASLVVIQAHACAFEMEMKVKQWIKCYRDLLDQWRLWQERARFDVNWRKVDHEYKAPQQVFISCNYCGKTISSYKDPTARARQFVKLGGAPNKSKFSSCPGCRKPLPRCALCLVHMGTPSGAISTSADYKNDKIKDLQKLSTFDAWFTWCQTCRHGGHANHLAAWFKNHAECPVTGCNCKCMSVDSFTSKELDFVPGEP